LRLGKLLDSSLRVCFTSFPFELSIFPLSVWILKNKFVWMLYSIFPLASSSLCICPNRREQIGVCVRASASVSPCYVQRGAVTKVPLDEREKRKEGEKNISPTEGVWGGGGP
jgi:hypothetical protein